MNCLINYWIKNEFIHIRIELNFRIEWGGDEKSGQILFNRTGGTSGKWSSESATVFESGDVYWQRGGCRAALPNWEIFQTFVFQPAAPYSQGGNLPLGKDLQSKTVFLSFLSFI